jgi:hypothetical protein
LYSKRLLRNFCFASDDKGTISCDIRDIISGETGKEAADLGRFEGAYEEKNLGPHVSRFVLLSDWTQTDLGWLSGTS